LLDCKFVFRLWIGLLVQNADYQKTDSDNFSSWTIHWNNLKVLIFSFPLQTWRKDSTRVKRRGCWPLALTTK